MCILTVYVEDADVVVKGWAAHEMFRASGMEDAGSGIKRAHWIKNLVHVFESALPH